MLSSALFFHTRPIANETLDSLKYSSLNACEHTKTTRLAFRRSDVAYKTSFDKKCHQSMERRVDILKRIRRLTRTVLELKFRARFYVSFVCCSMPFLLLFYRAVLQMAKPPCARKKFLMLSNL